MSFRKNKNSYDEWTAFRDKMGDLFIRFINENLNSVNQKDFEEYLTKGSGRNFHIPLAELSDEKFLVLEKIVNGWESFDIGFDAFYSERIRRFNRYG